MREENEDIPKAFAMRSSQEQVPNIRIIRRPPGKSYSPTGRSRYVPSVLVSPSHTQTPIRAGLATSLRSKSRLCTPQLIPVTTLHFSGSIPRRASKNLSFPSTPSDGPCAGRDADPNPPYRITLPSSIFQPPSGRIFRSNDSAIAGSSGTGNPLLSISGRLPNRHGNKNTAPGGLTPGGIRRPAIPPERGTDAGAGRCTTSRRAQDSRSAATNPVPGSDS